MTSKIQRINIRRCENAPLGKMPEPLPAFEEIRQHAYQIFLERNGATGTALDDWLLAEYELKHPQFGEAKNGLA